MRRLALLLVAGCTLNPAFDQANEQASDGSATVDSAATSAGTTAPTTTLGPDTGTTQAPPASSTSSDADSTGPAVDLTTSTATTTTTVDGTTTAATTVPGTEATGDPCPGGCDECHVCADGLCVPTPGATCDAPDGPDPCIGKIATSIDNGLTTTCFGYDAGSGECDPNGACKFVCVAKSALETCDSRCVDADACAPGTPTANLDPNAFCLKNVTTTLCGTACELKEGSYKQKIQKCNADGVCAAQMQVDCQNYACELPLGCKDACTEDSDCAAFAHCEQTYCAPD